MLVPVIPFLMLASVFLFVGSFFRPVSIKGSLWPFAASICLMMADMYFVDYETSAPEFPMLHVAVIAMVASFASIIIRMYWFATAEIERRHAAHESAHLNEASEMPAMPAAKERKKSAVTIAKSIYTFQSEPTVSVQKNELAKV